jgi:hypothetical protein
LPIGLRPRAILTLTKKQLVHKTLPVAAQPHDDPNGNLTRIMMAEPPHMRLSHNRNRQRVACELARVGGCSLVSQWDPVPDGRGCQGPPVRCYGITTMEESLQFTAAYRPVSVSSSSHPSHCVRHTEERMGKPRQPPSELRRRQVAPVG